MKSPQRQGYGNWNSSNQACMVDELVTDWRRTFEELKNINIFNNYNLIKVVKHYLLPYIIFQVWKMIWASVGFAHNEYIQRINCFIFYYIF